jgi:hypothetical protein
MSGKVLLENLQIKSSLFDLMPLPFKLHFGKVGRIFLDLPMMSLFSSPVKVEISDVFMIIKPKDIEDWKEDVEVKSFKEGVQGQLE